MLFLVLSLCFAVVLASEPLPPGQGGMTVALVGEPRAYETDAVIELTVTFDASKGEIPATETEFNVVLRKCDQITLQACMEPAYTTWIRQPYKLLSRAMFAANPDGVLSATVSVRVESSWQSNDYWVSIESQQFGKVEQNTENYIYGISDRLKVIFTKGKLYLREPRDDTVWQFDKEATVEWTAEGFSHSETVSVQIIDSEGNVHDAGAVQQEVDSGSLTVLPKASWGEGGITVRIQLSNNDFITSERSIELKAPAAYFQIVEPNAATVWNAQSEVNLLIYPKGVPATTNIQISAHDAGSGDTRIIVPATQGLFATKEELAIPWVVPDIKHFSSGWVVKVEAGEVTSYSEPFSIRGSGSTGPCTTKKLQREMHLHDEMICEKDPFIMIVQNQVRITKIVVEWLWCLDDRLRISMHIQTSQGGGSGIIKTSKKIGAEPTRVFQTLHANEHGSDFFIAFTNIQRLDGDGSKTLTGNLQMFTADPNLNEVAGISLKQEMSLSTTDPECECPYEDYDEFKELPCQPGKPPCLGADDPACAGPCVPGDLREQCVEQLFPRDSRFTEGSNLCSNGLQVNVHSTPCQEGDKLLFTVKRKTTKMKLISKTELPGCDKYWLNVQTTQGQGFIIASLVQLCRDNIACVPGFNCPTDGATSFSLSVVVAMLSLTLGFFM